MGMSVLIGNGLHVHFCDGTTDSVMLGVSPTGEALTAGHQQG